MRRIVLLITSAFVCCLCGFPQIEPQPIGICLIQLESACAGYNNVDQCTLTCTYISLSTTSGYYQCQDQNGGSTSNLYKLEVNKFSTIGESDVGFCEEGPPQNLIYCSTRYDCSYGCTAANVGQVCGPINPVGDGPQVRSKVVNPELPCPDFCDDL